jgi:hemerythrin-like domain-containing protein
VASSPAGGTLVGLWANQHRVILQAFLNLSRASQLDLEQQRLFVQRLRQRLSRHIQLERHALYPLLRAALGADPDRLSQLDGLEQQMRGQIPELTCFLHQAERDPQRLDLGAALHLYQQLRAQFMQEEKVVQPLFAQHVSLEAEEQQLRLFRKRLQASTTFQSSANSRRTKMEEWERQAVTRPVLSPERC